MESLWKDKKQLTVAMSELENWELVGLGNRVKKGLNLLLLLTLIRGYFFPLNFLEQGERREGGERERAGN